MSRSHYEVLGVLPSASQDEIRVAYRMRAREVHPDTSAGKRSDSSTQMAQIAEAWRVLSDTALRRAYDAAQSGGYTQLNAEPKEQFFIVPVQRASFPWRMVGFTAGGLIALFIIIFKQLKGKYNASQTLGIELGAMYWHFLDLLWIYLFLFLFFFE